jgi:hypothetical protein
MIGLLFKVDWLFSSPCTREEFCSKYVSVLALSDSKVIKGNETA